MRNSNTILASVQAFMDKMQDGDMREQNEYMESFIKTFKTECLDRIILTSDEQLWYVVREFLLYYNHERPHSGLGGRIPDPWPQDTDGEIVEFSRLGGLLKSYRRVKQAA